MIYTCFFVCKSDELLNFSDYFPHKVSSIASMPIWQFILKKFGKKSTFAAGMIVRNIAQLNM